MSSNKPNPAKDKAPMSHFKGKVGDSSGPNVSARKKGGTLGGGFCGGPPFRGLVGDKSDHEDFVWAPPPPARDPSGFLRDTGGEG